MAARVCPVFNEHSAFIGVWALNPGFEPTRGTFAELMSLAEPTLTAFSKLPYRRVPNNVVEVGNGVRFESGVFLMLEDNKAPNEELSLRDSKVAYVLIDFTGITCLKRVLRTDSRIKKLPPVAAPPPNAGEIAGTSPAQSQRSEPKRWWQIWK